MDIHRRNPVFALFVVSLALAVAIAGRALWLGFALREVAALWPLILLCPAVLGLYCRLVSRVAQRQAEFADVPRSDDFDLSSRRVGTVGRRYLIGVGLIALVLQAQWLAGTFGLHLDRDLLGRGLIVCAGALMVHFGNVLPKMQPLSGISSNPETFRASARLLGWVSVVCGTSLIVGALLFGLAAHPVGWLTAFGAILVALVLAIRLPRFFMPRDES